MNTIWSTYIQKIGTLYDSRTLRFSDLFRSKYENAFQLKDEGKILEIGCGPGALAQSLHRWYPHAEITGIDRDSNFVRFASGKAPDIHFVEGDALKLPFSDNSFDVTISNTVSEHVDPSKFFAEQYRVLKPGGVCLVLSARKGVNIAASCVAEKTAFETEIWKRVESRFQDSMENYQICAYPMSEAQLPLTMEQYGFQKVSTDYLTINLTPDHPGYSREMAYAMITANQQGALDSIDSLADLAADLVTEAEREEMKRLVRMRYEKRLALYDAGNRQWDTNLSLTMVVRGVKEC